MVSLSAGLRASGNGSAATTVPTRMSTARNASNAIVGATGSSAAWVTCMDISIFDGANIRRPQAGSVGLREIAFRRLPDRRAAAANKVELALAHPTIWPPSAVGIVVRTFPVQLMVKLSGCRER